MVKKATIIGIIIKILILIIMVIIVITIVFIDMLLTWCKIDTGEFQHDMCERNLRELEC